MKKINPDTTQRKRTINRIKRLLILLTLAFIITLGITYAILRAVNRWFDAHELVFNKPVQITLKSPIEIKERQIQVQQVVNVINEVPEPKDLVTDAEKKIFELWGLENYKMAISVATAESKMNCNALNINTNGSADFSIFQVNSLWIKKYSLEELADCDRNIEIAHEIWDNGDRELGNGKGSWGPWVTAKNGAYLNYLQ